MTRGFRWFDAGLVAAGLMLGAPGLAAAEPIRLSSTRVNVPIGRLVEFHRDKSRRATFETIRALPSGAGGFEKGARDVLSMGTTDDIVWVRFVLRNEDSNRQTYYLEYSYPPMDHLTLYVQQQDGTFGIPRLYGDHQPFAVRELKHRNLVFPIALESGQQRAVYIRFQSESIMDIPLAVWSVEGFHHKDHDEQYVLGIYYGIMFVMLLYNLFIFLSARDVTYLYYAGYIICISTMEMAFNGLAFEYLWPNWVWWNSRVILFSVALGLVCIVQFSRHLLDIKRTEYRRANVWADVTNALFLIMGVVAVFSPLRLVTRIGIPITISAAAFVLALGLIRLRAGYHPARLFMFAWSFFLVGAIAHMLKNGGVLPSMFFTNYGIQVGSALEVVLLSFALADKINVLRREKEQAQARYIESQKAAMDNQLRLMNAFYRFVPGEFIKNLEVESIADIQLGDAIPKDMTILFTDIRDFTGMSERMTAQENFNFLNSFLKRMEPHIENNRGFVDKFIGDAIMALYSESSEDALRSAIGMRRELVTYNIHRDTQGYQHIDIGIGINSGEVILGTVGSLNRIDTTVIGNTVNLAAGLESLTKIFRVGVLVSGYAVARLKDPTEFCLREIDQVRVKGKAEPVVIYELFDADLPEIIEKKKATELELMAALVFYKTAQFPKCLDALGKCREVYPEDPILDIYQKRCEHYIANPPKGEWDGVSRLRA